MRFPLRFPKSVSYRRAVTATSALSAVVFAVAVEAQKVHQLPATPTTVAWGFYWAGAKPALTVNSGDIVEVETIMTNNPAGLERMGVKPEDIPQWMRDLQTVPQDQRGPGGHVLTGPIYVTGADSGDVLEVRMLSIDLPIAYGYNGCSGYMREFCRPPVTDSAGRGAAPPAGAPVAGAPGAGGRGGGGGSRVIYMDRQKMTAEIAPGITVPLRPFWGSIGVAPSAEKGRVNSNPPSQHAGNMDNKELVAGTTLYVPVWTKGALLELGDGHATQGDGEVDQTGLETNLKGRIQVIVRKDLKFDWPRIETKTHWITMGTDTSLVVATKIAIGNMVKLIQEMKGVTQIQAYQAASMAADLRITELVDGNLGVHMMINKEYLKAKP